MSWWILADAHGGADAEADRGLVEALERARGAGVDLLLLGDLFLAWAGPARFLTPLQRTVMDALAAVRRGGRRVIFVVGNRDYLVEAQLGRAFDEVLGEETVLDLGGVPTLVAHGDRLDPDDRLYVAWHRLSRHPLALGLFERVPPILAERLARRIERALAGTNTAYKAQGLPLPRLEALGRRARARGAARALVGHFHVDRTIEVEGASPVRICPPWLEQRRVLRTGEDGALQVYDPLGSQGAS